jgi:methylmalonyl-CoA mutase N-terminal domain/subunit
MEERKERFTSLSGLPVERVYTKDDLKQWSPEKDLGEPGAFPYTRGIHPTMYRGRPWTIRLSGGHQPAL